MPTANWLAAAKEENREAVAYVSIQDTSAAENTYGPTGSTDGTWGGSVTLDNVSTTEIADQAYPLSTGTTTATLTNTGAPVSGFFAIRYNFSPETFEHFLQEMVHSNVSFNDFTGGIIPPGSDPMRARITIRSGSHAGTIIYQDSYNNKTFTSSYVSGTVENNDLVYKWTMPGSLTDVMNLDIAGSTNIYVSIDIEDAEGRSPQAGGMTATRNYEDLPQNGTDSNLTTSTIDMGATPDNKVVFTADDTIDADASIVYSALGGNADPPVTSLGTIVDGQKLDAYRYYRITAQFNSTSGGRGIAKKITLQEGVFKSFGTHLDNPFIGVHPHFKAENLKTLSAKIDLQKGVSSTGQLDI